MFSKHFSFFLLLGFLFSPFFQVQAQEYSTCQQAYLLVQTIQKYHYAPRELDASFQALVVDEFVQNLDPYGSIFTSENIPQIEQAANSLVDDLKNSQCTFLDKVVAIYEQQLAQRTQLIQAFQAQKWVINRRDKYMPKADSVYLSKTALATYLEQNMHLNMLLAYLSPSDSAIDVSVLDQARFDAIKQQYLDRQLCRIELKNSHPEGLRGFVAERYLNAITHAFDPHTSYFSATQKKRYDNMLASEALSFGFQIAQNEKGELIIDEIAPGGPAWKSNAMNEGDVLLSIKAKDGEEQSFGCMGVLKAIEFMQAPKVQQAVFSIRKKSGETQEVALFKDKIDVDDNVIQSLVLEGEQKIGYIYLPSFYTDMNTWGFPQKGCANELATALIKLKREGIEALIFDVRNNGGGSMDEAIRVAGMFIDYGTVTMTDMQGETPALVKDQARGVLFDKPLIVLQNQLSASASELFAGTMQDYHRGLIVGAPSFGKATMQAVVPADAAKYNQLDFKGRTSPSGYVKLTIGKFFRVTGKSHQGLGVQPDINLPQRIDYQEISENNFATALPNTSLDKDSYFRPLPAFFSENWQTNSQARLAQDSAFIALQKQNKTLLELEATAIPLHLDGLQKYVQQTEALSKKQAVETTAFQVKNPSFLTLMLSQYNTEETQMNVQMRQAIQQDAYIREAYFIALDLLK